MSKLLDAFVREASERLPGVLYSFNIADFKRRNVHLGYTLGDEDVAELNRLLADAGTKGAFGARTHGDRWFMLAPPDDRRTAWSILERFTRSEPFLVGWEARATKDGVERTRRETVPALMMRVLRCLYAPVTTREELDAAVAGICKNDYSLPVVRPIALSEIPDFERRPWRCVSRYPETRPSCPFCGAREIDSLEGDDAIYGDEGTCKGCGARIVVREVSKLGSAEVKEPVRDDAAPPADPPPAHRAMFEDLGYRDVDPIAHYRIAIAEAGGERRLVSVLRSAIAPDDAALRDNAPWDLELLAVRRAWDSEDAPSVLVEALPRGTPSTRMRPSRGVPPFVRTLATRFADAHAAGRVVGELHPTLVFVDSDGELVACAQRPLRAERAAGRAAHGTQNGSTRSGMAPMFFDWYLTRAEVRGEPSASQSEDVFRLAAMVWRWRRGVSPFGAGADRLTNTIEGRPVHPPADDLDRTLVRAFAPNATERPSAADLVAALLSFSGRFALG